MPVTIPLHARNALNTQDSQDEPILLMEVTDTSLGDDVLRFSSFPLTALDETASPEYGVISVGNTYIYALSGSAPGDKEGSPLTTTIALDNVTQEFTEKFLALTADNEVTILVILASDPDTPVRAIPLMRITQCVNTVDSLTLSLDRNLKVYGGDTLLEPWPSGRQTIDQAPGLHRQ
jgi:hypothetical protein